MRHVHVDVGVKLNATRHTIFILLFWKLFFFWGDGHKIWGGGCKNVLLYKLMLRVCREKRKRLAGREVKDSGGNNLENLSVELLS